MEAEKLSKAVELQVANMTRDGQDDYGSDESWRWDGDLECVEVVGCGSMRW